MFASLFWILCVFLGWVCLVEIFRYLSGKFSMFKVCWSTISSYLPLERLPVDSQK